MPVLTYDSGSDTYNITVADDLPPNWVAQESSDGGTTWSGMGSDTYGTPIPSSDSPGNLVRGFRADSGFNPTGPQSNILVQT